MWLEAFGLIAAVLAVNMVFVVGAKICFEHLKRQSETLLGKYFGILMRTNALLIGAIGVEMVVHGIEQVLGEA